MSRGGAASVGAAPGPEALRALEADLRGAVRGAVSADAKARALYAQDASHYRQPPLAVVVPADADDAAAAMEVARVHAAPVLPRGAGTSLAGQGCNAALVLDLSRHLDRIVELDPDARLARVQPGVVLDDLRRAAGDHGLTFGPDPSTHAWCTVGGMIGNNACGVHSVMAGRTVDNVEKLDVLLPEGLRLTVGATSDDELVRLCAEGSPRGELYRGLRDLRDDHVDLVRERFPVLPRRVSGYNLDELLPERGFQVARALTGTEGTCALVLEATVRLVPSPPARVLLVLGFPDSAAAADRVPEIMAAGPTGLEGTDGSLVDNMRAKGIESEGLALLPDGGAWLLVELGGETRAEAEARARSLLGRLGRGGTAPPASLIGDPAEARKVWLAREAGVGASARLADGSDTWSGWEDAAVPPERLGDYLRSFRALVDRHGLRMVLYGHYGQGCVHTRMDFDLVTEEGVRRYRSFVEEAADLVAGFGGSLSGEHGDGHSRAELLPRMFGEELVGAFARFRALFDPRGRMNPGKVVAPYRLDEHLRLGAGYRPPRHDTHFAWPDDGGSFARAAARCVGVGKCRRAEEGTMCPSFMVTREEEHSTRGRARLLFEMSEGRLPGGWADPALHGALDLCLACKGCKRECPAGVDVASYKAEAMAQRFEGRLRPPRHYAFGWFHRWARLATLAPPLARAANAALAAPGLGRLAKAVAGVAPARELPRFAPRTFVREHRRRRGREAAAGGDGRARVLLWPDTFTNHLGPAAAHAAVAVLEDAGFAVELPPRPLCCGRPLYDVGMLPLARRLLARVLETLAPALDAGHPVVVLEPSCLAVFRDELRGLFPDDPRARRLRELAVGLAAFLEREAPDWRPPRRTGTALLHGHCHQEAVGGGIGPDRTWLERAGLDVRAPDTGCCGMAGSFGFDARHHGVSVAVGERVLLPAVRALGPDALVVTDGFSCREQIASLTPRRAFHLAEVLAPGPLREPVG